MKSLIFPLSFVFLLALHAARGAEAEKPKTSAAAATPAASPAASAAPKEPVQPVELKTKSVFALEANARNPFWPIGFKPAAKIADAQEHVGPELPATAFVVSSITIENNTKFAIVNGKIMQEGQQFGLQLGGQTYQVTLKRIEDGRVVIGKRDQEIFVPLRRK